MRSTSIFDAVIAYFTGGPRRFEAVLDQRTLSFVSNGRCGPWTTYVQAFEAEHQVAAYGVVPFAICPAERAIAAELVTRINFGLVIGSFELDFTDGEARCKTSVAFEGAELVAPLIGQIVQANLALMDGYLPAFVAVAARDATAAAALALVE
jgi:hypothetical protein